MRCIASLLMVIALGSLAWGAAAASDQDQPLAQEMSAAEREVWRSAWTWEARGRGDLARAALDKLLRTRPQDVNLMLEMALIELRANRIEAAQDLRARIASLAPGSAALAELDTAIRVLGRERIRLASIRRLLEVGRPEEALAELRALFPEGPPGHTLGLEYWRIVADTPGGWTAARDGFAALVAACPTDPRYRLALARHLTRQAATRREGLQMLMALSAREDLNRDELIAAWRAALDRAAPQEVSAAMLRQFAALVPDDAEAQAWARAGRLPARATAYASGEEVIDWALRRAQTALALGKPDLALMELEAADAHSNPLAVARLRVEALLALERFNAAMAVIDVLRPADADARAEQARLRAQVLAARARAQLARGERAAALRDLEQAVDLQPADPWLRYTLARQYAALGVADEGERLLRELVQRRPRDADARFALGLYLEHIDRLREVPAVLAPIAPQARSDGMRALEGRARIAIAREQARAALDAGRYDAAVEILAAAEPYATDAGRVQALAYGWIDIDRADRARALVERALAQTPDDIDLLLVYVRVLAAADAPDAYAAALQQLRARTDLPEAAQIELDRRLREVRRAHIADLRRSGDAAAALAAADAELAADPDPQMRDMLLRERAAALVALERPAAALADYAELLERAPDDAALRLDQAEALEAAGRRAQAKAAVRAALAHIPVDRIDLRLRSARRLRALGAYDEAAELLAALRAQVPDDAGVLEESGWLARARRDYAAARSFFLAAQSRLPDKPVLAEAIAAIDARRQRWISAGFDIETKPGEPGISDVRTAQLPVEWRWARGYDGHWFGQIDSVDLDVGRLPADYDSAALYGTVQANGPAALASFPDGFVPRARGTAVGVGYENDDFRVDLGTTPLGFTIEDWVGGVRLFAQTGAIDWSFDVARRPMTSSLVAYAGARDPVSPRVWGGVRRNAAAVRAAYYGPRHSATLTLDAARLTGRDVPDNDYFGLRASYDWRIVDRPSDRVFIGLTATFWDYALNQRFYTYGHGGYYSPQTYLNIGLPVLWQGARGRWTYEFGATLAHSRSQEDAAPFYPTDPVLQAQAQGAPLPAGFDAPVYDGGRGAGWGYGLRLAVERQLDARWALGLRAALDRSDFYEPEFATLYLRRVFDEAGGVLRDPPRPPRRYADY
ncbi:Cellulose synthase operon protein C C-terminus (BCSC_C) [Fontimonas thermophila]|uniref:Cellulose synthase operon protein C C-terminus (BCSC_C) n=1 Tax=Fontimonas thermophila TaxID=1076937 RepID=A0A1I2JE56_9GAMM|nr:cellulose synthase subunit BcsC-related outer membrane protein [Fontimonas thermophila]SFF53115.1 Cellulose synthase operon protein C C-terminus (BCSC_C) [Fontimonas thermophila]